MILESVLGGSSMFSALFSFLGGSAFRAIWGEVSNFITAKQEHSQEMEAMRLQSELDDKAHARELEKMRLLSEIGIKEVQIKSDAEVELKDAEAFVEAMKTINVKSGIKWIDGWNSSIRPAAATTALAIWWFCIYSQGFVFTEWDKEMVGAIIGFFFAHRHYAKK